MLRSRRPHKNILLDANLFDHQISLKEQRNQNVIVFTGGKVPPHITYKDEQTETLLFGVKISEDSRHIVCEKCGGADWEFIDEDKKNRPYTTRYRCKCGNIISKDVFDDFAAARS